MLFYQTYREHIEEHSLKLGINKEQHGNFESEIGNDIQRTHYDYGPRWSERVLGYHIIRVCIESSCTNFAFSYYPFCVHLIFNFFFEKKLHALFDLRNFSK